MLVQHPGKDVAALTGLKRACRPWTRRLPPPSALLGSCRPGPRRRSAASPGAGPSAGLEHTAGELRREPNPAARDSPELGSACEQGGRRSVGSSRATPRLWCSARDRGRRAGTMRGGLLPRGPIKTANTLQSPPPFRGGTKSSSVRPRILEGSGSSLPTGSPRRADRRAIRWARRNPTETENARTHARALLASRKGERRLAGVGGLDRAPRKKSAALISCPSTAVHAAGPVRRGVAREDPRERRHSCSQADPSFGKSPPPPFWLAAQLSRGLLEGTALRPAHPDAADRRRGPGRHDRQGTADGGGRG